MKMIGRVLTMEKEQTKETKKKEKGRVEEKNKGG